MEGSCRETGPLSGSLVSPSLPTNRGGLQTRGWGPRTRLGNDSLFCPWSVKDLCALRGWFCALDVRPETRRRRGTGNGRRSSVCSTDKRGRCGPVPSPTGGGVGVETRLASSEEDTRGGRGRAASRWWFVCFVSVETNWVPPAPGTGDLVGCTGCLPRHRGCVFRREPEERPRRTGPPSPVHRSGPMSLRPPFFSFTRTCGRRPESRDP